MATPPNDDTRTLFKLISDGQWHNYEEIRDKIAATVPPGRALRKYQERVEYTRRYKEDPAYDTQMSEDERIYYGQRACGQIVITSWKGKGIQYRGEGSEKQIRVKPGFKSWGLANAASVEEPSPDPPPADSEPSTTEESTPVQPSEPIDEVPKRTPEQGTAHIMPWQLRQFQEPEMSSEQLAEVDRVADVPFVAPAVQVPTPLAEAVARNAEQMAQRVDGPSAGERPEPKRPSQPVTESPESYTCPQCGSLVYSREAHEGFHAAYERKDARTDMALFAEGEMRSLLGDVMGQVLDEFQVGMQAWMVSQFSQLEGQIWLNRGMSWRGSKGR